MICISVRFYFNQYMIITKRLIFVILKNVRISRNVNYLMCVSK